MISIHFFYTGVPLTIWDLRSVDDLESCQDLSGACYASVLERFNEGGLVFWSNMIKLGDEKCWAGFSIRSDGLGVGTFTLMIRLDFHIDDTIVNLNEETSNE
jgi:hypothetical protein